jgi:two-component system NtrC family sensor kinase
MRSLALIFPMVCVVLIGTAQTIQTYNIDSLRQGLEAASSDTARIMALNNLARNVANSDTAFAFAQRAFSLSRDIGLVKGEAEACNNLGLYFNQKGNYPASLEYYLKAIQLAEEIDFREGLKRSYNSIATVYFYRKDFNTAILYGRKARNLARELKDWNIQSLADCWIGRSFLGVHETDSALKYAQEAYELASEIRWPLPLYLSTRSLGDIFEVQGNQSKALEFLRLSLQHAKHDGRFFRVSDAHQRLAEAFANAGHRDSTFRHAQIAFALSQKENLPATLVRSSLLLSSLYEGNNNEQSLKYHKIAMSAQDSLFSLEKNSQIEALNLQETLRQRELETARQTAEINRRNNLQFAAIGLGVVLFVILFLMISRSVRVAPGFVRFLGVLALLLVFEFANLLLEPLIAQIANNTPVYMLIAMVIVGGLLIPVHQLLEKKVIHRLVEKNRLLREELAGKSVAEQEIKTP